MKGGIWEGQLGLKEYRLQKVKAYTPSATSALLLCLSEHEWLQLVVPNIGKKGEVIGDTPLNCQLPYGNDCDKKADNCTLKVEWECKTFKASKKVSSNP